MSERKNTWHVRHKENLSRGERAADVLRNGMGSWTFVGLFIAFMAAWAAVNSYVLAVNAWDPYPYILLNLFLSMLAGLQGAILLIAAKRQDAIAAAMARHDYDTDVQSKAEIERLMAISIRQLEMSRPPSLRPLPPRTRSVPRYWWVTPPGWHPWRPNNGQGGCKSHPTA